MIFGWLPFIYSIFITGYILLGSVDHLRMLERIGASVIIGSAAFPFILFLLNTLFHIPVLAYNDAGDLFAWIVFSVLTVLFIVVEKLRRRRRFSLPKEIETERLFSKPVENSLIVILLFAIAVFFYQISYGLRFPIFGWDEYSYWLYTAKALYLHHGLSTVEIRNAYASYPLGFPYLVAWCYRLTGGISIAHAKWILPILTTAFCLSVYSVLRRIGVQPLLSLAAIAMTVWGTQIILWYNFVAFGELIFVVTYGLAVLYAMTWMVTDSGADLWIAGLLFGLSSFLRVDGVYIDIFTLVCFAITVGPRRLGTLHAKVIARFMLVILIPIVSWKWFEDVYHARSGWLPRLSMATILRRLQPNFLGPMLHAEWMTVSNMHVYPIMSLLAVLVILLPIVKSRLIAFPVFVTVTHLIYLFVAYLSVFSGFEALHASAMNRYLLSLEPLIAVATILLLSGKLQAQKSRVN